MPRFACCSRTCRQSQLGFTLMELVMVIVLLGIVTITSTRFIHYGVETYLTGASRQHMASTGRFLVERLSRELRNAVPGSVQLRPDLGDCVEFRPVAGAFSYLQAPIAPEPSAQSALVMGDPLFDYQASASDYVAVIYPLEPAHVYVGGGRAAAIAQGGYNSNGDQSYSLTFTGLTSFSEASPAKRLYVTREVVSYCYVGGQVYRFAPAQLSAVSLNDGVLMAQWFANQVTEPMFQLSLSDFSAASLVRLTLRLAERGEEVVLNHEIHLLQAP